MRKLKNYFHKVYGFFPVENVLNFMVIAMVAIIIILATLALYRPINPEQYKKVVNYSTQAAFPKTQRIAEQLSQQEHIKFVEYLRMSRAYDFESSHVKNYPAVDSADSN